MGLLWGVGLWLYATAAMAAPTPIPAPTATAPAFSDATQPLMTVSIEFHTIPQMEFQRLQLLQLQQRLLMRLIQAGFAVVGAHMPSQLRASFSLQGQSLKISFRGTPEALLIPVGTGTQFDSFHLEVIHKVVVSVREQRRLAQSRLQKTNPDSRRPPPPVRSAFGSSRRPIPAPLTNRWRAELDLGLMGLFRVQNTDFLVRLGFRYGQENGFGLYTTLFFTPSAAAALNVYEWGGMLGPSWRFRLLRSLSLETGLLAGFSQHAFTFSLGQINDGFHWDFLTSLFVLLNWQMHRVFGLRGWFSVGVAPQSRAHQWNDTVLWERSWFRLEFGVSVYFSF